MRNMKSQLPKTFGIVLALSMLLAFTIAVASAQTYPTKPVRLIIPFPPGGSNDIVGRLIATQLTERLGKQVVAENHGGAGGVLGTEIAAKSAPDGYTLLIVSAAYAINPSLYKVPYDPVKSFVPVAILGTGPNVLVVHPSVPVNSVKDLIALAKKQPGKLTCAAAGVGSFQHLGTELFKSMAGIDFMIVQFKGGGPSMIDVLGGHTQFAIGSLIQFLPHINSGKLKALGTGGSKRSIVLPDVSTIAEAGVPGYEGNNWWGILAPAGTPQAIVDRLHKDLTVILTSAETQKQFLVQGAEVAQMGQAEFGRFITAETVKWARVVKEADIKAE
ncbi:MAG: tripartite tricarboxylate transporter substrate binding protein [Candidatus Eisenbacteria bacterium]|nr:tripartite tricarboxylate transporter substrate binding protein [Candidatus Eisenbacteria bacterium]